MKFTRLRLSGFKSFVEPTDLLIEPGLTGVVGPNGCGKSNLLEALRWVMGESSYKSMRASGMDDVIFSGTTQRPARNMAEVVVTHGERRPHAHRPQYNEQRDARDLAPHRARGGLGLPHQRQGRARPRRAAAVRRCLDRRALAGAGAPGPDRRDHQCQAAGPPPHSRRGRRHHRPSYAPPRGRTQAQGGGTEPHASRRRHVAARNPAQQPEAPGPPGAPSTSRFPPRSASSRRPASMWPGRMPPRLRRAMPQPSTRRRGCWPNTRARPPRSCASATNWARSCRPCASRKRSAPPCCSASRTSATRWTRKSAAPNSAASELDQRIAQINADLSREQELLNDTDGVLATLAEEAETAAHAAQGSDTDLRAEAAAALQAAAEALARAQEAADQAAARAVRTHRPAQCHPARHRGADVAACARLERELSETAQRRARTAGAATMSRATARNSLPPSRPPWPRLPRRRPPWAMPKSEAARRAPGREPTAAPPMTRPGAGPTGCRRKSVH